MSDWLGTVGSPLLAAAGLASHLSCRWASFEKLYLNPRQQQVVDRTPVVVVGYASERASLYTRGFRAGTSAALLLILKQLLSLSLDSHVVAERSQPRHNQYWACSIVMQPKTPLTCIRCRWTFVDNDYKRHTHFLARTGLLLHKNSLLFRSWKVPNSVAFVD